MGEYMKDRATGERIKVGTCEELLYLRFDQLDAVAPCGDANPHEHLDVYRFRFPWPDEDGIAPGMHSDPFRELGIYGVSVPAEVPHRETQFTAPGYNVMLPCPEGPGFVESPGIEGAGRQTPGGALQYHRNGNPGPVRIVGQAVRHGRLVLICRCGGCKVTYNVPTIEEAEPTLAALRRRADQERREWERARLRDADLPERCHAVEWWEAVADRIAAGYELTFPELATADA